MLKSRNTSKHSSATPRQTGCVAAAHSSTPHGLTSPLRWTSLLRTMRCRWRSRPAEGAQGSARRDAADRAGDSPAAEYAVSGGASVHARARDVRGSAVSRHPSHVHTLPSTRPLLHPDQRVDHFLRHSERKGHLEIHVLLEQVAPWLHQTVKVQLRVHDLEAPL